MIKPNKERIENDLLQLAQFSDIKFPSVTRRFDSEYYIESRNWLITKFRELGLSPFIDQTGNLIVEYGKHTSRNVIVTGSHTDSVTGGGKFDGTIGVVGGLEIIRCLIEQNIELRHNILLIDFFAEESTEFGLSTVGSRGLVGSLTNEQLDLRNRTGKTLQDIIEIHKSAINADTSEVDLTRIARFIELHIEQGPVLEFEDKKIGLVTGINGLRRLEVIVSGESNHAGTTPLNLRKDAFLAAAEITVNLRKQWKQADTEKLRITIGKVNVFPNLSNVIPGRVEFSIDLRAESNVILDSWAQKIEESIYELCILHDVSGEVVLKSRIEPVMFDSDITDVIKQVTDKLNLPSMTLKSGAIHDSSQMSHVAKTGMIFVPSVGGKSHCESEFTDISDICYGIEVLANSILQLDQLT